LLVVVVCWTATAALAAEPPSLEKAAEKLQAATVTVRVTETATAKAPSSSNVAARVSVCSGVSVGRGTVVTYVSAPAGARIRVTLPGGDQAEAKPRVVDHFSGLTLLDTGKADLPGIELADALPKVGAWVLGAAAWGIEKPVVSLGILSGADRSIPGASFPPLLQCDLRTAETSSGSGLVDRDGKLIGIVVATEALRRPNGWTFAVPVSHVKRLMRARSGEKVVVLKSRRPVVGLVLEAGSERDEVVVQRVVKGGPADKAGIKVGDQILTADGLSIRSVYQAVVPLMKKQPGDTMVFLVQQKDGRRTMEVTLGGGIELPTTAHPASVMGLVDPRVEVARTGKNRFDLRDAQGGVRNLSVDSAPPGEGETADGQIRVLQRALDRYAHLIEWYRDQLHRRDGEQTELEERVRLLKTENAALNQQLEKARRAPKGRGN